VTRDSDVPDFDIEVATEARLFGLSRSNRDFSIKDSWGKNKFNTSFPAALCCYMASIDMEANYLRMTDSSLTIDSLSVNDLFGVDPLAETTHFSFETAFSPFDKYAVGGTPNMDLVVSTTKNPSRQTAALEVKLTAIPDNTTHMLSESEYGPEIVIRPDTIFYLAAGLSSDNPLQRKYAVQLDSAEPLNWSSNADVLECYPKIHKALLSIATDVDLVQRPNIIQVVWKTQGKTPQLADQCLDLFVWSTGAFLYLVLDIATPSGATKISRNMRTAIWTYKTLLDIARTGATNFESTIDTRTFDRQNDKAFSAVGRVMHKYMAHPNLTSPRIKKTEIKSIILGGGQRLLSPERRFDASIVECPEIFSE
jgi:type II restriction enzyme